MFEWERQPYGWRRNKMVRADLHNPNHNHKPNSNDVNQEHNHLTVFKNIKPLHKHAVNISGKFGWPRGLAADFGGMVCSWGRGNLKDQCEGSNEEQTVGGVHLLRRVCSPCILLGWQKGNSKENSNFQMHAFIIQVSTLAQNLWVIFFLFFFFSLFLD